MADDDSDDIPVRPVVASSHMFHPSGQQYTTYEENFARGLGLRPPSEFRYAGGDAGKHFKWFKLAHPNLPQPAHATQCLCTHPIHKNRWIFHISDPNTLLTVGSHCIKRFKIPGPSCPLCDELHKDRTDIWCGVCRGGKFTKGRNGGRTYRRVMIEDMAYCKRTMMTSPGVFNTTHRTADERNFVTWLRSQPEMAEFVAEQENIAEVARIREEDAKRRRELQILRPAHIVAGRNKLEYGTFAQCTYQEMKDTRDWYCKWVLGETKCGVGMARFQKWLKVDKELRESQ